MILAVGIMMFDEPYVILVGRFIYGMSCGAFTVICPKFISEVAPTEYKGPYGALSQLMCVAGILVLSLLCLAIPDAATKN